MIKLLQCFCAMVCLLSLQACSNDNYSNAYLLTHPKELRAALDICQGASIKGSTPTPAQCTVVLDTTAKFSALIIEQQMYPEAFGDKIMHDEDALAATKEALRQAQETYQALQKNQGAPAALQTANDQLTKLEQTYHGQQLTVQAELAVITLSSPD
jgi:hypothetical protein